MINQRAKINKGFDTFIALNFHSHQNYLLPVHILNHYLINVMHPYTKFGKYVPFLP